MPDLAIHRQGGPGTVLVDVVRMLAAPIIIVKAGSTKSKVNYLVWDETRCALIRNEPLLVIVCTCNGSKMFDNIF